VELNIDDISGISSHLISLGWLSADNPVAALEVAGEGNMNLTLRAQCQRGTLILKQSRDHVAKYPTIPAPVERLDVEAAFYQAVSGHPAIAGQMPQLIGYDAPNHLLALEDLGPSNDFSSRYGDAGEQSTQPELPAAELLGWLAELHSLRAGDTNNAQVFANQAMRELNHAHIFVIPLQADNGLELPEQRAAVAQRLCRDTRLAAAAQALGSLYLAPAQPDSRLLHGDFYPGSWLALADGIRVIDVEFAFFGAREFDLGVFAAHCVMTGSDPEQAIRLLRQYPDRTSCDQPLIEAFAGMEIIRRLLGVAQLPITAPESRQCEWLDWAYQKVCQ
jgi:5-methylthioribose kinase